MSWFTQIFRRGWEIVGRSPWILWIPLLAVTLLATETRLLSLFYLSKNPEARPQLAFGTTHMSWSGFVSLYQRLPSEFVKAVGEVTGRMFSGLGSGMVVTLLFFFEGAVVLHFQRKNIVDFPKGKRSMLLGIISAAAGFFYLIFFPWLVILQPQKAALLLTPFFSLAWVLASAIAYSILLEGMDMVAGGREVSFVSAATGGIRYLKPLFLFFLISGALSAITLFPFVLPIILNSKTGPVFGVPYKMALSLQQILIMMVSFVPLLVVTQNRSFLSAFDSCISLWAVHWKNLAAFVVICASLLLIPYLLTAPVGAFFPPFSWGKSIIDLLEMLLTTVLGVLVLCSAVVLLKELQE